MKIIINTKQNLYRLISNEIITLVKNKPTCVLGLPTGETPISIYKLLAKDFIRHRTDYSHVQTFNLDEYVGINEHDIQSYRYFMNQHLFAPLNMPKENTHFPNANSNEIDNIYSKLKDEQIDLQLLGIGSNGHIGFNEPGTPFDSVAHLVELSEGTRKENARFFSTLEEVPTHAVTMGISEIMAAKKIILIAIGKKKAEAVYQMVLGHIDIKWPATILRNHPDITIYLDDQASSLLNKKSSI